MELENFLKERKIDPKIIAVLIDLKEPLDKIIEYLKEHNLEMDGLLSIRTILIGYMINKKPMKVF